VILHSTRVFSDCERYQNLFDSANFVIQSSKMSQPEEHGNYTFSVQSQNYCMIREADSVIDHGSYMCVNGLIGVPRTDYHCRMNCRKGCHEQFILSSHLCLLPSSKWSLCFLFYESCMAHPPPPLFDPTNNYSGRVKITKLLIMSISLTSCFLHLTCQE
jgi:hypothetical protein